MWIYFLFFCSSCLPFHFLWWFSEPDNILGGILKGLTFWMIINSFTSGNIMSYMIWFQNLGWRQNYYLVHIHWQQEFLLFHEDAGSIPSLAQWVKDLVLPWAVIGHRHGTNPVLWLWHRPAAVILIPPLAWETPYATGVALKKQNKTKHSQHTQQR